MTFKVGEANWELMISFLEAHRELATGRFTGPNGKDSQKKLWAELGVQLNSLELGCRSAEKWQKTWIDYKYLLKKKAAMKKKEFETTGGGSSIAPSFTELEPRTLNLLGDSFYKGTSCEELAVTKASQTLQGQNNTPVDKIQFRKPEVPIESTAGTSTTDYDYLPTPKKKKKTVDEDVQEAYQETITVLKEIKNVVEIGLDKIAINIGALAEVIGKSIKN